MTALRERFMAELRHHAWRRFSRLLPDAAGKALCCALWASLLFELSVQLGVCSRGYFLLPGTFFVMFLPYFLWKDRPKLMECAREADDPERGGNCALNAFELISRGAPASPFAEYAVVRGLEALAASERLPHHAAFPWRKIAVPLVLLLGLLALPDLGSTASAAPEKSGKRKSATKNVASLLSRGISYLRPEVQSPSSAGGKAGGGRDFFSGKGLEDNPGRGGGESSSGNAWDAVSGGAGASESAPGNHERRDNEECSRDGDAHSAKKSGGKSPGGGASGSGEGSGEDENTLKDTRGIGASGAARGRSDRERRKRSVTRRRELSRGGFQMLPADKAPPASRKLADKEEHGDEPGTGRGGETGAKKSRGAAAVLPVMPRPDSVSGRIGSGEDVTSVENGTNSRRPGKTEALSVPGAGEEPGPSRSAPARIRLSVRRIFDDNVLQRAR